MTKARNQPFCIANNNNVGYFTGIKVFPRSVTIRNHALLLHNNKFCLIWKSEKVRFNEAMKELKDKFKIVDNYITEENVNSLFKYEFIPKKIDSHLTNFIVYDLETHNTDRARPYCKSFDRISKLAGRYNRDLISYELDKCRNDTFVFDVEGCICNALEFCLKFKGEERKVKNRIVEYNLQLHAHNGSGFDSWISLNTLPCDKRTVDIIKNRKGIISLKVFNGFIQNKKNEFLNI